MTEIELSQLLRAEKGEDIRSSDRPSDRARTRLMRLGYLGYDWSLVRWYITPAGRAALEQSREDARRTASMDGGGNDAG